MTKPEDSNSTSSCKRVGYFRMNGVADELRLSQLPGKLCSHIVLAYARIELDGSIALARKEDKSFLSEVAEFKRQFPAVKILISVSNSTETVPATTTTASHQPEQDNGFSRAALLADNRQRFARSAVDFLQRYSLDGLDLDWQYPNYPTNFVLSRDFERTGFTKILKTLRSAIVENFFNRQVAEQHQICRDTQNMATFHTNLTSTSARQQQQPNSVEPYLLTVAIAGQEAILRSSYELKQLANLCDWLHVKSYDYFVFKAYAPFTGPNSPLRPIVDPFVPILSKLSFAWTLNRLLDEQIPRDKIVMGIPTYGRAYKLVFRNSQPSPFTLALGPKLGPSEEPYLRYPEVCALLERADTVVEFDARARVPYLLTDDGTTWITYENSLSVREKVRYVLDNKLCGFMTWNLNCDAFFLSPSPQTNGAFSNTDTNSAVVAAAAATQKPATISFPLHQAMNDEVSIQSKCPLIDEQ